MQILLQAVVVLIALLLTPGLLFHFDVTPKVSVLLAGTSLSLLFFRKNCESVRAFVSTQLGLWFTCALLAQLIWTVCATVGSTSVALSLYGGAWRRFGLITFAALMVLTVLSSAWMAGSAGRIQQLLRAVVASGAVLSLYGIFQYFGLDTLMDAQTYQAGEGPFRIVRPPGTFGHADYFATWLVLVAFAGISLARLEIATWARVASVSTVVLTMFAIVLTGTRAALVGLVIGVAVLAAFRAVPIRKLALAAAVGVLLLGAFVASPLGSRVRARVHWSTDDTHGGARLLLWRDSVKMSMSHFVKGFGPEVFSLRFPLYESADLARTYPDFYHESPHNVLLDELTAQGVPALLLFLAMVGTVLWQALRASANNWLVQSLLAALVSLFVCQMFSVFVVGTAFAFYLCAAMLVSATVSPSLLKTGVANGTATLWMAAPALALSICFGIYALKLTIGDYYLGRASSAITRSDPDGSARDFRQATRWLPPGPADDLYLSLKMESLAVRSPVFLIQAAAWREAVNHAVRAAETAEDRQNAWYNLAVLLARENDAARVERSLRNTIEWAPNWFKPHWKLAEILALSGRRSEALREAKAAVDLDGGRDAEVTATYNGLQ